RRRHTRFSRDWSSDVCSSDLFPAGPVSVRVDVHVNVLVLVNVNAFLAPCRPTAVRLPARLGPGARAPLQPGTPLGRRTMKSYGKIGRASCRERGESEGGAVAE